MHDSLLHQTSVSRDKSQLGPDNGVLSPNTMNTAKTVFHDSVNKYLSCASMNKSHITQKYFETLIFWGLLHMLLSRFRDL